MATKREMQKRISLIREDLREMEKAIRDNRWEDAYGDCMNVQGDIAVIMESLEDRGTKDSWGNVTW